eukprot:CAMPEP_0172757220 /NCGR_PEP_ID=MMETSP1074-20121228/163350_1 /TAXON_ID=2916 /ORGANISM="Ceratium fusus, Strain PA161109" /LENGTH=56 /DNA_ID=CAMNT_0013590611 /DNA_START=72 /DNA_END=239 /DNA_ORIENTATION=-
MCGSFSSESVEGAVAVASVTETTLSTVARTAGAYTASAAPAHFPIIRVFEGGFSFE